MLATKMVNEKRVTRVLSECHGKMSSFMENPLPTGPSAIEAGGPSVACRNGNPNSRLIEGLRAAICSFPLYLVAETVASEFRTVEGDCPE
jgi:hypothetical protein